MAIYFFMKVSPGFGSVGMEFFNSFSEFLLSYRLKSNPTQRLLEF